jgi:hypothetical protein
MLDEEANLLASDFAQLEMLVSHGWEDEMIFNKRETRQYQSAV